MDLSIPRYFALYNLAQLHGAGGAEKAQYEEIVAQGFGRASDCSGCRACEAVCPQHILISERMQEVSGVLEG
jgi:predicted aldo/keto reductase-like oxidoreductase